MARKKDELAPEAEIDRTIEELRRKAKEDPAETFEESLRCELTEAEIRERADRCARAVKERDQVDADRQASNKEAKTEIERLEIEIRSLAQEIREHATYRHVSCVERVDQDLGVMQMIRLDTGEVARERQLTASERQQALFPRRVGGGLADDSVI